MSKKTKLWLIIAVSLIVVGGIIFTGVLGVLNWDFTKLSTVKYQTKTYEIEQSFKNISVKADTTNIDFLQSEDGKIKVVCHEEKKLYHEVSVNGETLEIRRSDNRKWYDYIGINFGSTKITVYIPKGEYGELSVKNSTGNVNVAKEFTFKGIDIKGSTGRVENYASAREEIKIKLSTGDIITENITASTLELTASTGKINASQVKCQGDIKIKVSTGKSYITDAECQNFISSGSTGSIILEKVIATEKFSINRSTGDVKLDNCDTNEIFIETDTGDVKGTLLSDKVFITNTDTGRVDVPQTATGGRCEITTDTGDIKIEVK